MRHLLALLCLSATTAVAQPIATPVLSAMQAELDRSMEHLKSQPSPPYFLSYEVTEINRIDVSGAFGTLTRSSQQQRRNLDIDLRVGDYKLDNTHPIRGGGFNGSRSNWVEMPTDNDPTPSAPTSGTKLICITSGPWSNSRRPRRTPA